MKMTTFKYFGCNFIPMRQTVIDDYDSNSHLSERLFRIENTLFDVIITLDSKFGYSLNIYQVNPDGYRMDEVLAMEEVTQKEVLRELEKFIKENIKEG